MENAIHLKQEHKLQSHPQINKEDNITVVAARYICDYSIAVSFSSGPTQLVNFLPLFEKNVKEETLKYFSPERFKKFIVKNGNICWGKNEDIIFPVSDFFKGNALPENTSNEILYII